MILSLSNFLKLIDSYNFNNINQIKIQGWNNRKLDYIRRIIQ